MKVSSSSHKAMSTLEQTTVSNFMFGHMSVICISPESVVNSAQLMRSSNQAGLTATRTHKMVGGLISTSPLC